MDELDKNIPDDFWRKAFDEAAETPPPRVWSAIERRLDESEGSKILPLWGLGLASSRPLVWGMGLAAAVTLLLVGWWAITTRSATQLMTQAQKSTQPTNVAATGRRPSLVPTTSPTTKISTSQNEVIASRTPLNHVRPLPGLGDQPPLSQPVGDVLIGTVTKPTGVPALQEPPITTRHISTDFQSAPAFRARSSVSQVAVLSYAQTGPVLSATAESALSTPVVFEELAGKPMRLRQPAAIQRIVWARPVEPVMEPVKTKSKHEVREMWASVSMMPGSFNPMVSVRSAQSSFANSAVASLATTATQSAVNSRANFSVAYQAGAGIQLTERWSVESGVGYLSGRSTVETPGQQALASIQLDMIANRSGGNSNLYVDALRNSVQAKTTASNAPQTNYNLAAITAYQTQPVYNYGKQQILTNNYQYIQVPVQVGYQIRSRKRFSIAVLGGILTNIFVKNTVGNEIVVSAKDGVYKPVSLAATMGARFRYRPSRQWSASLAGVYQPSLESGTQADSQVHSRLTSAGMSFGVDYHF